MIDGGASSQRVMVVKKTQVVSRVESLLECPTRTPTRSAIVVTPLAAKTSIQVESFVSLSLSTPLSFSSRSQSLSIIHDRSIYRSDTIASLQLLWRRQDWKLFLTCKPLKLSAKSSPYWTTPRIRASNKWKGLTKLILARSSGADLEVFQSR